MTHTVELLDEAIDLAKRLGFTVREEWLGGHGGGACEIKGRKCLFLDLALSPVEQLDQVAEALRAEAAMANLEASAALRRVLRACA
ncbi:MAG: hypothetical protein ACYC35_01475 [Pirellulales bacterium]